MFNFFTLFIVAWWHGGMVYDALTMLYARRVIASLNFHSDGVVWSQGYKTLKLFLKTVQVYLSYLNKS